MKLIVHAPNVHRGGGRVLFLSLLRELCDHYDFVVTVDSRLEIPVWLPRECVDRRVRATWFGRMRADWRLRCLSDPDTTVLCLGNLPPIFKTRGRVLLYLQNRYLTGGLSTSGFSRWVRTRIALEKLWLRSRIGNVTEVIVQTPSMAVEAERTLGVQATVLPFAPRANLQERTTMTRKPVDHCRFDFIYVASGEPHKNHRRLLEAWNLLAREDLHPALCLTVDADLYPDLVAEIEELVVREKLNVVNIGEIPTVDMEPLYADAGALIYPSFGESLGLPLLEARNRGMPIVASEADFVRDIVQPIETFDPGSAVSIARAVKRYLDVPVYSPPVLAPREFLETIVSL